MFDSVGRREEWPPRRQSFWVSTITIPLAAGNRQGNEDSDENHPGEVRARRVGSGSNKVILPRQESFASLHILTRRASEGSEALPSLACRVRMSFFGARVIVWRWDDEKLRLPVERLPATIQARDFSRFTSRLVAAGCSGSACRGSARSGSPGETSLNRWPSRGGR